MSRAQSPYSSTLLQLEYAITCLSPQCDVVLDVRATEAYYREKQAGCQPMVTEMLCSKNQFSKVLVSVARGNWRGRRLAMRYMKRGHQARKESSVIALPTLLFLFFFQSFCAFSEQGGNIRVSAPLRPAFFREHSSSRVVLIKVSNQSLYH